MTPFESPLEQKFFQSLPTWLKWITYPQATFGNYRADFAMPLYRLIVEIDGHDYHSTPEQKIADANRDRFFAFNGWTVLRYTGREVHGEIEQVILEVTAFAEKRWWWIFWTVFS